MGTTINNNILTRLGNICYRNYKKCLILIIYVSENRNSDIFALLNFINMAMTFTDANFEAEVMQTNKLNVIDFWAPWCGPCLAIGPTIESLATEYEGKVNVGKVNVDENSELSIRFGITSIPCILFIKGGKVVDKQVGAVPKAALERKIVSHM
jgi:thioredoxin 1